jgi:hypothetical protein
VEVKQAVAAGIPDIPRLTSKTDVVVSSPNFCRFSILPAERDWTLEWLADQQHFLYDDHVQREALESKLRSTPIEQMNRQELANRLDSNTERQRKFRRNIKSVQSYWQASMAAGGGGVLIFKRTGRPGRLNSNICSKKGGFTPKKDDFCI